MAAVLAGMVRSFFEMAVDHAPLFGRPLANFFTSILRYTNITALMAALRRDSKVADDTIAVPKRHMVHLKTKEECRLGNETIQVWTVELPSKHAEGILRQVHQHHFQQHSLTMSQSHQGQHPRPGRHRPATPPSFRQTKVSTRPCSWQA